MTHKPQLKRQLRNWKSVNREMARESRKYPSHMVEIPPEEWPPLSAGHDPRLRPVACWRSNRFFAQVVEEFGTLRISINRASVGEDFDFTDGIAWDDIQRIKNEIGYADKDCIEIYPAAGDLVNIANIRHIWVLDKPHPWNWAEAKRGRHG